jgi:alpha-tubulin suppressor-like RCC1 family protein
MPQILGTLGGAFVISNLFAWGLNTNGRLGDGTTTQRTSPVQIGSNSDWGHISAGSNHTVGIRAGQLWTWGAPTNGRLGNGTTTGDVTSPAQIGSDNSWRIAAAGGSHCIAVKNDGTLWSWGRANEGQLGNGTNTPDVTSPAQIGADTDWLAISCHAFHNHAIKTDGTLWSWGAGFQGRLGSGNQFDQWSPVQIGSDTDWAAVSAGGSHGLAIKTNGTLWSWGNAANGRLGNGTTTGDVTSPAQIGNATDWAAVAAGEEFSLALKTDGTLWSWGLANNGRLGNGTTTPDVTSPTQVGSATDWASIGPGGSSGFAIKTTGSLWAWGLNTNGRLGDGTTTQRTSPVQIGSATDWRFVPHGRASAHMAMIRG